MDIMSLVSVSELSELKEIYKPTKEELDRDEFFRNI